MALTIVSSRVKKPTATNQCATPMSPPAVHAGVPQELPDDGQGALDGVVCAGAGRYGLAEPHEVPDLKEGAAEQCHADHDQDQRHDDRGELHWGS
ncbi:hypothetical protein GCM10020256_35030 [Streptomyces thermocoprophilus]